jgi:membrane protein
MRARNLRRASLSGLHLVKQRAEGPRREHEQAGGWWQEARALTVVLFHEMHRTRAWTVAAAMAFYYLLSLFPLLVVFSSALKFLPLPNLFQQLLNMMAMLVPPYAMQFVEQVVIGILRPNRTTLLSVGVLGYLWTASGGFVSLIEAMNIAYDVPDRRWWKDRLHALLLAITSGALVVISLIAYIVGPHFLHFLRETLQLPVPPGLAHLWPAFRMIITFVTFVAALEIIYYLGPNTKHRFLATLPGAVLAIAVWFVSSWILSFYLENASSYNATYGSMGALIGLMAWFYLTGLAILLGAELNGERIKYKNRFQRSAISGQ